MKMMKRKSSWTPEEQLISQLFKRLCEEDRSEILAPDLLFVVDETGRQMLKQYGKCMEIVTALVLMAVSSLATAACVTGRTVTMFQVW